MSVVQPKASVSIDLHGDETWTPDKNRDLFILKRVVEIRLLEALRENKGGVYYVGAGGHLQRAPHGERSFVVHFGCDPGRVEESVAPLQAALYVLTRARPGTASNPVS